MGNLEKMNFGHDKINTDFNLKEILLEITDKCPLECIHCSSNGQFNNKNFIPEEIISDILRQGKKLNATRLQISGGEPFLHKDIISMSSHAAKMNFNVSIYSCGNIFTNQQLSNIPTNIFESLKEKNKQKIIFGIHGIDKKTHEFVTQKKGSFVNLLNSIRNSLDVGIKTELHFVPNKKNINQIEQLLKFAENIGISRVSILRFVKHGRGDLNCSVYEFNENITLFDTFSVFKKSYGDFLRLGSPYNPFGIEPAKRCSAGYDKITITPNLKIYPCVAFKSIIKPLNYYDFKLSGAFNSNLFQNIRNASNNVLSSCNSCKNLTDCMAGCVAQRLIQNKNEKSDKDNLCMNLLEENYFSNFIHLYGECNAK